MDQYIKENYVSYEYNRKISISKIVLDKTGLYLIFNSDKIMTPTEKDRILNMACDFLRIVETNMYNVIIYHICEDKINYINIYNNTVIAIDGSVDDDINNKISERVNVFDDDKIYSIKEKISFSCDNGTNIKYDSQGNPYVRKNKKWLPASDTDTEKRFWVTVFGGCFGIHKIMYGRKIVGFLYLATCGLFGFGWFFDVLELLLGMTKDQDGLYLLPLENKKKKLFALFGVVIAAIALLCLYLFLLNYVGKLIMQLVDHLVSDVI